MGRRAAQWQDPAAEAARSPSPSHSSPMAQTITTPHAAPAPVQTGAVARQGRLRRRVRLHRRALGRPPGRRRLAARAVRGPRRDHRRHRPQRRRCTPALSATAPEGVVAITNVEQRGLSGARNSGLAVATGSVVAFLDDDAVAEPDWLERMLTRLRRPGRDRGRRPGRAGLGRRPPRLLPGRVQLGRGLHLPRPAHDDRAGAQPGGREHVLPPRGLRGRRRLHARHRPRRQAPRRLRGDGVLHPRADPLPRAASSSTSPPRGSATASPPRAPTGPTSAPAATPRASRRPS